MLDVIEALQIGGLCRSLYDWPMMKAQIEVLQNGRIHHHTLLDGERPFTTHQTLQNWQTNETFRRFFINLLADAPFDAYFWETPPLTEGRLERPFEFVLVDAPQLSKVCQIFYR